MDGANLNHLSRALAFVLITFLLNLAAVPFMGLRRVVLKAASALFVSCRSVRRISFLLQVEDFESASQALIRVLQIAVGEGQGLQSHPVKPEWNVRSLCRLSEWWEA